MPVAGAFVDTDLVPVSTVILVSSVFAFCAAAPASEDNMRRGRNIKEYIMVV